MAPVTTPAYGGLYTFIVPQLFSRDIQAVTLATICKEQKFCSCVLIHPFSSVPNFAIFYKDEFGDLQTTVRWKECVGSTISSACCSTRPA